MKSPVRSVAWLLPFLLTGCFELPFHKKHPRRPGCSRHAFIHRRPFNSSTSSFRPRIRSIAAYTIYNMREEAEPIPPPVRRRRPPNPDDAATAPEQRRLQPLP